METCNNFFITFINLLFLILLLINQPQEISSSPQLYYQTCGDAFTCGEKINAVEYPFRGSYDPPYCGYSTLILSCSDDNHTSIEITGLNYTVLEVNPTSQTMVIAREDLAEGLSCPQNMVNSTVDHALFDYYNAEEYTNVTFFYGCPDSKLFPQEPNYYYVPCGNRGGKVRVLQGSYGPGDCEESVVVPVSFELVSGGDYANATRLNWGLRRGFEVKYSVDDGGEKKCGDCLGSNGRCGFDLETNRTTCFCKDPPYVSDNACPTSLSSPPVDSPGSEKKAREGEKRSAGGSNNIALYMGLAGGVLAAAAVTLGCLAFYCRQRKKQRVVAAQASNKEQLRAIPSTKKALISPHSTSFSSTVPSKSSLGRSSSYYGVPIFEYAELERATHNFDPSRELGDGGFGTVYHGLLQDGREVAIKLLYEHNFRRVEQFVNEIKILTKLSHENLVKLHGCTSRRSRELILVYEYVPNGTVADHLHGELSKTNRSLLTWRTRLNIAVETATALAYLHESEIIHRDVKTNNILLDEDFRVKVADFGLSRLFPCDATHVSTAPQGTPGYVDPEYYQCYKVTEKSDVYSFGVVLVELLSSLQAVDLGRRRSDVNLSTMAVGKIQSRRMEELFDSRLGFEGDGEVRKMMASVGEVAFRCLQQVGEMRPSMREVLEGLVRIRDRGLGGDCTVEIVDMSMDEDCGGGCGGDVASVSSSSDSTPLNPA